MREVLSHKRFKNSNMLMRSAIDRQLRVMKKASENTKDALLAGRLEYFAEEKPKSQIAKTELQEDKKPAALTPSTVDSKQPSDLEIIRNIVDQAYNVIDNGVSGNIMPDWYRREVNTRPIIDNQKIQEEIEPIWQPMDYEEELTDEAA